MAWREASITQAKVLGASLGWNRGVGVWEKREEVGIVVLSMR